MLASKKSCRFGIVTLLVLLVVVACGGRVCLAGGGEIAAWGENSNGQCTVPSPNADFIAVAAGGLHSLGIKADGSIAAWGRNAFGQCTVPSPNADFIAAAAGVFHSLGLKAESMGTAFTYQGQLYDSDSPAAGTYDFQFGLYDSGNIQQGNTLSMDDIEVIDGYFTTELDFGGDVFNGLARLLEVAVRPGQSSEPNDFVTLSPRQEITPAPYASYAANASYALQVSGISVDDDGNVGIGTTAPRSLLDIQGDTFMPKLILENTDTADGHVGIELKRGETQAECSISFQDQDTEIWKIGLDNAPSGTEGDFTIKTNNNSAAEFTIKSNGNVGIGTTNPQGKLDVNGSIYQRGGSLHADYVFAPGYELESIDEHSGFMWRNRHLKAIPKARADANGREILELGAHRKGIVEELEKAHIYIDQLNKENKEIKKQLAEIMEVLSKSADQQEGVAK